jgi:hypothetical protein
MTEHFKQIVRRQYEAALSMLKNRIESCPDAQWNEKVGQGTVRQDVYHALFWADYYLTPHEDQFVYSPFNDRGGDELRPVISDGLEKADTLDYLNHCHDKALSVIASETKESLEGSSGFPSIFIRYPLSRAELHLYNIRHIQHHTAQLSLYLRKLADANGDKLELPWIGTGWR